jgi:RNA polymerase sigma-70 factor (ECF subfamily)
MLTGRRVVSDRAADLKSDAWPARAPVPPWWKWYAETIALVPASPKDARRSFLASTLELAMKPPEDSSGAPPAPSGSPVFGTTLWTVVLAAGDPDHPEAGAALNRLCQTYWYPVYAYVRRKGRNPAEAEDLAQEFFSRLLGRGFPGGIRREGGKFRSYLLRALDHFLVNEWRRGQTAKRGGGATVFSLDGLDAETRYTLEPRDAVTPETLYDRRWAATVLETVRRQLRAEYEAQGKSRLFTLLEPCLTGGDELLPHAELMAQLDLKASALKMTVHRLRKRFGELLREEIAQTVATADEVEQEIRHLISVTSA